MPKVSSVADRTPHVAGYDVSHHNEPADWGRVPAVPFFACKAAEGGRTVAPMFREQWQRLAVKATRWRGCYHWPRSDSGPMEAQAQFFVETVDAAGGLLVGDLLFMDWERTPRVRDLTLDEVERYQRELFRLVGDRFMVYSAPWLDVDDAGNRTRTFSRWRERNPHVPFMLANYNTDPDRSSSGWHLLDPLNVAVWQFTSTASVPGFPRGIDANHVRLPATLDQITRRTGPMHAGRRLIDTRHPSADHVRAGVTSRFKLGEPGQRVRLNIAANGIARGGWLAVWGVGSRPTNWSTINYVSGQYLANEVERTCDGDGMLSFYASTDVHVLVDLVTP